MPDENIEKPDEVLEERSDVMDLSDDDFLKMAEPEDTPAKEPAAEPVTPAEPADLVEPVIEPATGPVGPAVELVIDDDPDAADPAKPDDPPAEPAKEPEKPKEPEAATINYEESYKKLMAPFKANGVEIQAKSVEDAVSLMQMGANYHKKMAGLKPALKTLKLLENNDLLDPEKLNFLIDINNKNPEAITKLIKDSGLDPVDIDTKAETTYAPTSRTVSDTEVELDTVLESIQDSPSYSRTLNVITKQWDAQSRKTIANSPHIISVINAQIEDGIYDKVASAVTYERSLGRLQGMSDFDAYKSVGEKLYNAGELAPPGVQPTVAPVAPVVPIKPTNSDSQAEAERKKRKKAVSSTRQVASNGTAPAFDPLAMSDEEFEKFDTKKLGL